MDFFEIEGGRRLEGRIEVKGNKNEALPVLAAVLLTPQEVSIRNLPEIKDVLTMIEILSALGVEVRHPEPNHYLFRAERLQSCRIPMELGERIRGSLIFAGALLARCGEAWIPIPGGDKIGRRRIDTHLMALQGLGAELMETEDDYLHFKMKSAPGLSSIRHLFLDEASVTATENALICAAGLPGLTTIYNAACEPHVQNLARCLQTMGADIDGIGTNRLIINGESTLHGAEHRIGPDHIEIGSFIALAAATHSSLEIHPVDMTHLGKILQVFRRMGVQAEAKGDCLHVDASQDLRIRSDFGGAIPVIDDGPWPQFPADLTSMMVVLATQCHGTALIFEKMFESRLFFVDKLIAMGAGIVLCDPHRAVIHGPTPLHATTLTSPDIRAGMALLIAALAAKGTSTMFNIIQIERGYEEIEHRLAQVGAGIVRRS
ncbi:MAG: UDP-N-acetylglucosamine 1-carboxyvinyltransferase [Candidatus Delongbacteria bacterium]|nr:UDP-N-acetylglucosamine 1-carboxyvinyltransferase [Candidatus Delongbacteria bacterium]